MTSKSQLGLGRGMLFEDMYSAMRDNYFKKNDKKFVVFIKKEITNSTVLSPSVHSDLGVWKVNPGTHVWKLSDNLLSFLSKLRIPKHTWVLRHDVRVHSSLTQSPGSSPKRETVHWRPDLQKEGPRQNSPLIRSWKPHTQEGPRNKTNFK